jgi:hypothetical protein
MEHGYAAIGRAVFAAQRLEVTLASIFEIFKMQTNKGYFEETGGDLEVDRYRRLSVTTVVSELSKKGSISSELDAILRAFAEDRHTLVHRWMLHNGWPDDNEAEQWQPLIVLAGRVYREAMAITHELAAYMVKVGERSQNDAEADAMHKRIAQVFNTIGKSSV